MQSKLYAFSLFTSILSVLGERHETSNSTRYLNFQDENNVTHVIDLLDILDPSVLLKSTPSSNYFLYTQSNMNTPQKLYTNNATSVSLSNYDATLPTVVLVHGWLGDRDSDINLKLRQAYLEKSDVNVMVVEWSKLSHSNYVTATYGVPSVGKALGKFLRYLINETGASENDLHLIGFSLGAHLVGAAARSLDAKPARITGLDPAGPLWSENIHRLRKTDAVYVEAIHTDRRIFGTSLNMGDTDFSVNDGHTQPGCILDTCSHSRAWQYYAATVKYNNLIGHKCENDHALENNRCHGDRLPMGNDDLRKTGSGIYRVNASSTYPYV